ncbi:MAG: serine/threonine-protein kinase [Verrucomicrobiota bacterium]
MNTNEAQDWLKIAAEQGSPHESWNPTSVPELNQDLEESHPHLTIFGIIGRGGMGAVYEGFDRNENQQIALKFLRPDLLSDDESNKRFESEVSILRELDHESIVKVIDSGQTQTGEKFYTMEIYDGDTLSDLAEGSKRLEMEEIERICFEIADGLQYIHEKGIVHRDIKPSNIFVCKNGPAKILDFGIAKQFANPDSSITRTHHIPGSHGYIPPELRNGEEATSRSDVFSLGVVTYYLISGEIPDIGFKEPSRYLGTSDWDEPFAKALAQHPNERFESPIEFAKSLRRHQVCPSDTLPKIEESHPLVEIGKDQLTLNGYDFSFAHTVEDLVVVLGSYSRQIKRHYSFESEDASREETVYIWDQFGMTALEHSHRDGIQCIQFWFNLDPLDVLDGVDQPLDEAMPWGSEVPDSPFLGRFSIGGNQFNQQSEICKLKTSLGLQGSETPWEDFIWNNIPAEGIRAVSPSNALKYIRTGVSDTLPKEELEQSMGVVVLARNVKKSERVACVSAFPITSRLPFCVRAFSERPIAFYISNISRNLPDFTANEREALILVFDRPLFLTNRGLHVRKKSYFEDQVDSWTFLPFRKQKISYRHGISYTRPSDMVSVGLGLLLMPVVATILAGIALAWIIGTIKSENINIPLAEPVTSFVLAIGPLTALFILFIIIISLFLLFKEFRREVCFYAKFIKPWLEGWNEYSDRYHEFCETCSSDNDLLHKYYFVEVEGIIIKDSLRLSIHGVGSLQSEKTDQIHETVECFFHWANVLATGTRRKFPDRLD